jgi:transcription antitermination protein NusB
MVRRSRAREVVLQLLFQWDQNPTEMPRAAIERFARDRLLGDAEMVAYSLALYDGVVSHKDRIDPLLTAAAENWRLSRMMPVDRNVLRLGAYELHFDPSGQPLEVVINEAIELARRFGSADSAKFVNGVLDKIAKAPKPAGSAPLTSVVTITPPTESPTPPVANSEPASAPTRATEAVTPPGMRLTHRLAYHNTEKMGCTLTGANARGVRTKKQTKDWIGDVIWFVEGEGQDPRRYSLGSVFVVDRVGSSDDSDLPNAAWGERGHLFDPKVPLNDMEWFPGFFETMGHFGVCPQTITDSEIIRELLLMASQQGFSVVG